MNSGKDKMLLDILKEAISIEIFGLEYYTLFRERVSDETARAILIGLFWDEEEHKEILENEYEEIFGKPANIEVLKNENMEKVKRIFPESSRQLSIAEVKDILRLGIRTEEKSIEFYYSNAQKTSNKKIKDLLLKLVRLEEGHKARLYGILHYLDQEGSWRGYSSFYDRWIFSGRLSSSIA